MFADYALEVFVDKRILAKPALTSTVEAVKKLPLTHFHPSRHFFQNLLLCIHHPSVQETSVAAAADYSLCHPLERGHCYGEDRFCFARPGLPPNQIFKDAALPERSWLTESKTANLLSVEPLFGIHHSQPSRHHFFDPTLCIPLDTIRHSRARPLAMISLFTSNSRWALCQYLPVAEMSSSHRKSVMLNAVITTDFSVERRDYMS